MIKDKTSSHAAKPPPSARHILVADDDIVIRMVATRVLEDAGYTVSVVENGEQAFSALQRERFDLVLMDCMMPVMDGFAATHAIREDSSGAFDTRTPIIALTSLEKQEEQERCISSGMNGYLGKPIDAPQLLQEIERCLGGSFDAEGKADTATENRSKAGLSKEFLDSIIDRFMRELPEVAAELQNALDAGDQQALRFTSHRLSGAAAVLGAASLSQRARELEQSIVAADAERVSDVTQSLIRELDKLTAQISE